MLDRFVQWLLEVMLDLGYPGIVVLMAMESSILPVPSELVMPPAGYWAAKGEMSFALAVGCGVLGSILGALANYFGAHWLVGPFLRRFGRYLLLSEQALARSERFFTRHGEISTFIGRMLPVVRHLISIPAGLHRMPLPRFIAYTGLGALVWCTVLTWIGYFLGQHDEVLRSEEVRRYVGRALWVLIPVLAGLAVVYVLRQRRVRGEGEGQG
jgi:membrane protein DedA with SNARE-associated domain